MRTVVVIPARYGSKRLPGKPLMKINSVSMLERVVRLADAAVTQTPGCSVIVATDDERIERHAASIGVRCVMTDPECSTGTERAYAAAITLKEQPDWVVNLQGDTPLVPPHVVKEVIQELHRRSDLLSVVTPVTQLTWAGLDALRKHKASSPLSGTTVIRKEGGEALWFSKNIIPAIRDEGKLSTDSELSPVYRHIGIYGFPLTLLRDYVKLPPSTYERLEGLEQLRLLENSIPVQTVAVEIGDLSVLSGIDTQADLESAENWIHRNGDPLETHRT